MKVKYSICIAMGTVLFACNSTGTRTEEVLSEKTQNPVAEMSEIPAPVTERKVEVKREGVFMFYVGMFEAEKMDTRKKPMLENKINIALDSISGEVLYGHSVVAGNIRPFKGTFSLKEGIYTVVAQEPGDNKYDGVFTFTLIPEKGILNGTWTANDKKLAVTERSYNLKMTDFKYDPSLELDGTYSEVYNSYNAKTEQHEQITDDAGKLNASTMELTSKDVENMYRRDLEIMRNAIYARHGYSFKNREMRYFFDTQVAWYIPVSTDVTKDLTELEKKNIELIKRYEKHAESYYDVYGR